MVRVIYDLAESCTKCAYNHDRICTRLGKYLFDICFERDCPLPSLEEVEQFTRYITRDKELDCHGNCRNWERWHYNKSLNTDVGVCNGLNSMLVCLANGKACEEFDEL